MDAAEIEVQVSKDEYGTISSLLALLNAQRTLSVDGPGMFRESVWALFEPALAVKVTQDDAGKVTVLVNDVQPLSGMRFLEMVLAAIKTKAKAGSAA